MLWAGGERSRKGAGQEVGTGLGVPGALFWSQTTTRLVRTLTLGSSPTEPVSQSPPPPPCAPRARLKILKPSAVCPTRKWPALRRKSIPGILAVRPPKPPSPRVRTVQDELCTCHEADILHISMEGSAKVQPGGMGVFSEPVEWVWLMPTLAEYQQVVNLLRPSWPPYPGAWLQHRGLNLG